jgi:hypothetical protein
MAHPRALPCRRFRGLGATRDFGISTLSSALLKEWHEDQVAGQRCLRMKPLAEPLQTSTPPRRRKVYLIGDFPSPRGPGLIVTAVAGDIQERLFGMLAPT